MTSLIGKVLKNRKLPANSEMLSSLGKLGKKFVQHPVNTIKKGLELDKVATNLYKNATGKNRIQAAREVVSRVAKGAYNGGGKDLTVNTGGFLGSKLGAVAGIPGQLAGDYIGARVTRRALDDVESFSRAMKIRSNPNFRKLSARQKLQILRKRASGFAKNRKDTELFNDSMGWAIGNSAASGLQSMGSRIPLQGGGVAIASLPSTRQGFNVGRRILNRTGNARKAVQTGLVSTGRNLQKNLNPRRAVRRGLRREDRMRNAIDQQLATLPPLPPGVDFRRNQSFMATFSFVNRKNLKQCFY